MSVLLGLGDGTFLPAVSYTVGLHPTSIAVGDFNHDGILDIVTANEGDKTVSVLPGSSDGTFLPAAPMLWGVTPSPWRWGISTTTATSTSSPRNVDDNTVSVLSGPGKWPIPDVHSSERHRQPQHSLSARPHWRLDVNGNPIPDN